MHCAINNPIVIISNIINNAINCTFKFFDVTTNNPLQFASMPQLSRILPDKHCASKVLCGCVNHS